MPVSLSTGLVTDGSVNCDDALRVVLNSQKDMVGQNFAEVTIHRKKQSEITGFYKQPNQDTWKRNGRSASTNVEPHPLFFRLCHWFRSIHEVWTCTQPPSLFHDISLRKPAKAALASLLLSIVPPGPTVIPQNPVYVIDGGHPLHSVVWPSPATYAEICQFYVRYVIAKYGNGAVVIFDGHAGPPTTKSEEQERRATTRMSANCLLLEVMKASVCHRLFRQFLQ